jgi:hypothetical protein
MAGLLGDRERLDADFYCQIGERLGVLPLGGRFVLTNQRIVAFEVRPLRESTTLLAESELRDSGLTLLRRGVLFDRVRVLVGTFVFETNVSRMFRADIDLFIRTLATHGSGGVTLASDL